MHVHLALLNPRIVSMITHVHHEGVSRRVTPLSDGSVAESMASARRTRLLGGGVRAEETTVTIPNAGPEHPDRKDPAAMDAVRRANALVRDEGPTDDVEAASTRATTV